MMAGIPVGFSVFGVPRTQAALRRVSEDRKRPMTPDEARNLIRIALRALVMVRRATGIAGTCLSRSLALWTLLRRRGLETELVIGYRRNNGKIEGHAWLEFEGIPINEEAAIIATYTVATEPKAFDQWNLLDRGAGKVWWT
jgi:hypothetical protein